MVKSELGRDSGPSRGNRWLVLIAVLTAVTGALLWQSVSRWSAANPHRGELYQRTLENVRATCSPPKPGVESYCRDQALLLLDFPECDAACVALARKIRGEPTR
jgi:hypothetical protein